MSSLGWSQASQFGAQPRHFGYPRQPRFGFAHPRFRFDLTSDWFRLSTFGAGQRTFVVAFIAEWLQPIAVHYVAIRVIRDLRVPI
jgi:hypothetical protein